MRHLINDQQREVLDHIRTLVEEQKREISILYSELKLRLPTYLKSVTIHELKQAGVGVNPDIAIPKDAEERLRKYVLLRDKLREIEESFKAQITEYYANSKKELSEELRNKQLETLDDDEWTLFNIDLALIRKQYPRD